MKHECERRTSNFAFVNTIIIKDRICSGSIGAGSAFFNQVLIRPLSESTCQGQACFLIQTFAIATQHVFLVAYT
jgi:hypothetical protein